MPLACLSATSSQLIGPPVGGALFDRFGIRGPSLFGILVISIDLIGRLLLIERREALAWEFDTVTNMSASYEHDPISSDYAGPQYGTFTSETGISGQRGQQVSHISASGEADSTDSLLNRETADAHDALLVHIQHEPISLLKVVRGLCMSSRAMAVVVNSLVYG
jgi:MFS transporter, DHA1 family, solute carrier family 18 (vesicular amine transporter), member 1/2